MWKNGSWGTNEEVLVREEGLWEEGGIILAGEVMQKEALEKGTPWIV